MLDQPRDWRTPVFEAALAAAETVYFEVVMNAYATMTRLTLVEGTNRNGRELSDYMSAEQWANFSSIVRRQGVDPAYLQRMRPWLAELALAQVQLEGGELGVSGTIAGVESLISAEIDDEREFGLETADEQFELLSGRSDAEQLGSLLATAAAIESGEDDTSGLFSAWAEGDLDRLQSAMTASIGPVGSPYYRRMISDRNERWAVSVSNMLASNQSAMVIVGVGHLTGPLGLPTLLQQRGFTVERIDEAGPPAPSEIVPAPATGVTRR